MHQLGDVEPTTSEDIIGRYRHAFVARTDVEILCATPGESVRRLPSARFRLTLTSQAPDAAVLAEYQLDHTALPAP